MMAEGYDRKDSQKKVVLGLQWESEGVMDGESGELMKPMEEVPLKELGESELERLVRCWRREAGSWSSWCSWLSTSIIVSSIHNTWDIPRPCVSLYYLTIIIH